MIPWLDSGTTAGGGDEKDKGKKKDDHSSLVDDSWLYGDDTVIDTGVTSGADPTAWDPIGIEHKPDK